MCQLDTFRSVSSHCLPWMESRCISFLSMVAESSYCRWSGHVRVLRPRGSPCKEVSAAIPTHIWQRVELARDTRNGLLSSLARTMSNDRRRERVTNSSDNGLIQHDQEGYQSNASNHCDQFETRDILVLLLDTSACVDDPGCVGLPVWSSCCFDLRDLGVKCICMGVGYV